jgi:peptide chain release factor 1
MFASLEGVESRFEELTILLTNPDVIQDSNRFRELSKEHAGLQELVDTYREFKKQRTELEGAKDMLGRESDDQLRDLAKGEVMALEQTMAALESKLKILLLPKDPNDEKNVILEIRAGTGGDEAAIFVGNLLDMYQRYANRRGWSLEFLSSSPGSAGGFKEIIAQVSGQQVYSRMKYESGVHRVQRVPKTEAQGRIHTSTVTVAILPEAEDVEVDIRPEDLRIDVYRSSGPGGQSVNTTDSAVRVTHIPTGVVVACQDEKSQHKNKAKALKILKSRILDAEQQKQNQERAATRRSQVGTGDRSERIRTYNFPQGRVSDHRIGLTLYQIDSVMNGELDALIDPLISFHQAEALKHEVGT